VGFWILWCFGVVVVLDVWWFVRCWRDNLMCLCGFVVVVYLFSWLVVVCGESVFDVE
jgi:hypothetical protein